MSRPRAALLLSVFLLAGCLPAPPSSKTAAAPAGDAPDASKTAPLPKPPPRPGVNTGEIPKPNALAPPVRKTTPTRPAGKTGGKQPPPPVDPFEETAPDAKTVKEKAITRFPGIRIYMKEKRIEVKGRINLNRCPTLEFLGCTSRGKTHETLLLFECEPKQLHLALIMLGLEPTPQVTEQGEPIALEKGEKVVVEVSWEAKETPKGDPTAPKPVDGRVRRRVEDLIWDKVKRRSMPRVGWVFTGSQMLKVPAPPDYQKTMEVYAASYEGNVVATYHHPNVILDTPLIEGGDDTVYIPFTQRVPERGTHVIIHIRPWTSADGPILPMPKKKKQQAQTDGQQDAEGTKEAKEVTPKKDPPEAPEKSPAPPKSSDGGAGR